MHGDLFALEPNWYVINMIHDDLFVLEPIWCMSQYYVWPNMMHGDFFALKPIWSMDQFSVWPNIMYGNLYVLKYWCIGPHHQSTLIIMLSEPSWTQNTSFPAIGQKSAKKSPIFIGICCIAPIKPLKVTLRVTIKRQLSTWIMKIDSTIVHTGRKLFSFYTFKYENDTYLYAQWTVNTVLTTSTQWNETVALTVKLNLQSVLFAVTLQGLSTLNNSKRKIRVETM